MKLWRITVFLLLSLTPAACASCQEKTRKTDFWTQTTGLTYFFFFFFAGIERERKREIVRLSFFFFLTPDLFLVHLLWSFSTCAFFFSSIAGLSSLHSCHSNTHTQPLWRTSRSLHRITTSLLHHAPHAQTGQRSLGHLLTSRKCVCTCTYIRQWYACSVPFSSRFLTY